MKFMMFVCTDTEPDTASDDGETSIDQWGAKNDASGVRLDGDRLRPPADATVVRKRNGKVLVTDGPFAETREWIVGFDILECSDLDEAIAVAADHEMARGGRIELRPFWPFEA